MRYLDFCLVIRLTTKILLKQVRPLTMSFRFSCCIAFILLTLSGVSGAETDESWSLAKSVEAGDDVLYRLRDSLPSSETIQRYPTLAIIEWPYSPTASGMPQKAVSEKMYELEGAIQTQLEAAHVCMLAFTRIGHGQKKWAYYVSSKDAFESALAKVVPNKQDTPIRVTYSADPNWSSIAELQRLSHR